jgi:hypothetical protein
MKKFNLLKHQYCRTYKKIGIDKIDFRNNKINNIGVSRFNTIYNYCIDSFKEEIL